MANSEALAEMITIECFKPLAESKSEVMYGASFIKWLAEEGKRGYGHGMVGLYEGLMFTEVAPFGELKY